MSTQVRILIADRDTLISRKLAEYIQDKGFESQLVRTGAEVQKAIIEWVPDLILSDLILEDTTAIDLLQFLRNNPELNKKKIRFVVTSAQSNAANVKKCLQSGAVDYVVKPFRLETLIPRLAFYIQEKRQLEEKSNQKFADGGDFYLNLTDLVLREGASGKPIHDTLFNLANMLALTFSAVRCSIIECNRDTYEGYVRVSNDDFKIKEIKLDLNKYPEVMYVMNKEQMVAVENMENNPTLAAIKKHVQTISFNALIVCPVKLQGQFFGVMSVRMGQRKTPYTDRELRFAQLIANVASLVLSTREAQGATPQVAVSPVAS